MSPIAPLPVIEDVWRVALNWRSANGDAVNVMHFSSAASGGADLWEAISVALYSDMFSTMEGSVFLDHAEVIKLDGVSGTTSHTGDGWNGTGPTGEFVPALSTIIKFTTGIRGRSHRGRVFLPFVAEGSNHNGALTVPDVEAVTAAWTSWATDIASGVSGSVPAVLVVASYALATADAVITTECERVLGTQRRRQDRIR